MDYVEHCPQTGGCGSPARLADPVWERRAVGHRGGNRGADAPGERAAVASNEPFAGWNSSWLRHLEAGVDADLQPPTGSFVTVPRCR